MKKSLLALCAFILFLSGCDPEEDVVEPILVENSNLSAYNKSVVYYFKEVALGFEFGSAPEVTRKWPGKMRIFVGGKPTTELLNELNKVRTEIHALAKDGFVTEMVQDSAQCNYYIFFGSGDEYKKRFPVAANHVGANFGLFFLRYNSANYFTSGHMYVDIFRARPVEQKHLLREELTQSLGLAKDSPKYPNSIFQAQWTTTTEYAPIDKDLIRLLYHPEMKTGLADMEVEAQLVSILSKE